MLGLRADNQREELGVFILLFDGSARGLLTIEPFLSASASVIII